MEYIFHSLQPDERTWSFPGTEERLEALGYRFIGVAHVDEAPDMRWFAEGDMDDADLDEIDAAGHKPWPVYWHPELKTYAYLSGWLDAQPVLELRTNFADGSVLVSETRFRRMPRWQSKTEHVEAYMLASHRPELGSHVLIATEDPDEHHAAHHVQVATIGAAPAGDGSIQTYLRGANQLMAFKQRLAIQPMAVGMLYQVAGVVLLLSGLVVWVLSESGPGIFGLGLSLFGLLLVGAARGFPERLPQPTVRLESPL